MDLSKSAVRCYDRALGAFVLWTDGYEVLKGGLDQVMADSRTLRRLILEFLINISRSLAEGFIPTLGLSDEYSAHLSSLKATFYEAEALLQEGQNIITDWEAGADPDSTSYAESDRSDDSSQASTISDSRGLVERLARANLGRFQKIQEEKSESLIKQEQHDETASRISGSIRYRDSALGTSLATGSIYAETVMAYGQSDDLAVRVPPLPEGAKSGVPFKCLACGRILSTKNNSAWKKHLWRDLRPWICHDSACDFGNEPFASRKDWIEHLEFDHDFHLAWGSFECPLCHEETGKGKTAIINHLACHMEEISLAALPSGYDSDNDLEESGDEYDDEDEDSTGIESVECSFPHPRDHDLYRLAAPREDGLYHCPWEGQPSCNHKPEKLKANYDKFVESHLKPYPCKVASCQGARFSSTATLLRHEREAHEPYGHGDKSFLCSYEGCERSLPGKGFPRQWRLWEHLKSVHNDNDGYRHIN
ncbi:hypothetical protein NCS52_01432900 [Fusarium sp. LHS14.1]|nr:hypothetical protein NCS52_01432900 [Fusarium sp. LHS14.1]